MSWLVIERYVYDALNARATLQSDVSNASHDIARGILRDVCIYLADHMDDLREARARLSERGDGDAREMLAFVDETLAAHASAETAAREAIGRARRT